MVTSRAFKLQTLSLKASRALFSVKQSIFSNNIKPSAVLKIFDALIKPIALYNSEVWVGFKSCYQKKSIEEMFEVTFKGQNEFDKIFTRFSKFILGVHSKASNFAVLSELGQYPLVISALVSCINFWLHVVQSSDKSLINKAYLEQCNNSNSQWLNFVKTLLCDLGFSHVWENHCTFNSASLLLCIKNRLKERYEQFWERRMKSEEKMSKLRTYKLIKNKFGIEKYLELNERNLRKALSAFRISAHKLNIERGRYLNLKVEDGQCSICNVIEDEIHSLCQCKKFNVLRDQMYQTLIKKLNINKTDKEIFIDILTCGDTVILKAVGMFISAANIT